jgi:hypothetical protein
MATIEVTPETLIVHLTGPDRVLAFRGHLEVPLAHVASVEFNPEEARREVEGFWNETRIPGAIAPGHTLVGTFTEHGERIFWDVHHPERAVTIHLTHDRYAKLIVEVAHPEETASRLQQALSQRGAPDAG